MFLTIAKLAIAAGMIAFASWLSDKKPGLAGFIIALPLTSILALSFSYWQYQDAQVTAQFAKSIALAVPISLLFFAPFFLAEKLNMNFWMQMGSGLTLLALGYFAHQLLSKWLV